METHTDPTTITIDVEQTDPDSINNWAYTATDEWIAEAARCGITAVEVSTPDDIDESDYAGRVEVDGVAYDLTCSRSHFGGVVVHATAAE